MNTTGTSCVIRIASVLALTAGVSAQEQPAPPATPPEPPPPTTPTPPTTPQGLVPIPDYSGPLGQRPALTGDWNGARTSLANRGVTIGIDWTQAVQSVLDGGRDTNTEYGAGLDYKVTLDLARMGITSGLINFRAESRYGESVNLDAGPVLPVNTDFFFPLTDDPNGSIPFTITNLNYAHVFSPSLVVIAGKFDTLDGDANEFASGRGVSQFMNTNFVASGVFAAGLPYSTLGVSVAWRPSPMIQVTGTLANAADSSTTTGFEDFGDGWMLAGEAQFQYRLANLPGGMTLGGLYIGDAEFSKLSARVIFEPGQGPALPTSDSTWCIYWNAWHYLSVENDHGRPMQLTNGTPDLEGIGLFARAGVADDDTGPVQWNVSGGVGARGMIPGRDNDVFGVGYFYNRVVSSRLTTLAGISDNAQGVELFYNIAITPAAHLTIDFQWVEAVFPNVDSASVLGARLQLSF